MKRRSGRAAAFPRGPTDGGRTAGPRGAFDLRPLVDRLVDDVLRAIGKATLLELEALVGGDHGSSPPQAPRAALAAPRKRQRSKRATRIVSPEALPKAPREPPARDGSSAAPELDAITNPEDLLVATAALPAPVAAASDAVIPSDQSVGTVEAPTQSGEKIAVRGAPALRPGESVARASGAGVVIRRVRTA